MAEEDNVSISNESVEDDVDDEFDEAEDEDNGEDYEATLDEEEMLEVGEDYTNELRELEDEGEMSIEELRKKYGYGEQEQSKNKEEEEEEEEDESESSDEDGLDSRGRPKRYFTIIGGERIRHPTDDEMSEDGENDEVTTNQKQDNADEHEEGGVSRARLNLEDDDEDDADYIPNIFNKSIRIDEELYQAKVPLWNGIEDNGEEHSTTPLWSPFNSLTQEQISDYLREILAIRVSLGQTESNAPVGKYSRVADDEDALCALYRSSFDIQKAKDSFPFAKVNHPLTTARCDALSFDINERTLFEKGIHLYGKNFFRIQKNQLPYRQLGELVEYYYTWKKSERYELFRSRIDYFHNHHERHERHRNNSHSAPVVRHEEANNDDEISAPPQQVQVHQ